MHFTKRKENVYHSIIGGFNLLEKIAEESKNVFLKDLRKKSAKLFK